MTEQYENTGKEVYSYMDSCDGNGQHYMGGYTENSVLFVHTDPN